MSMADDVEDFRIGAQMTHLYAEIARLKAELAKAQAELESHSWEISPGMAQAKIDQLNEALEKAQAECARLRDLLGPTVELITELRQAVMYDPYTEDERSATSYEQLPLVRKCDKELARLRAAMEGK